MKRILAGAVTALLLAVGGASVLAYVGTFDVAADAQHDGTVVRLVEWVRERSIARRSADIVIPGDLADGERIRRGAGNYEAMCATCHLAPGIADSELRRGLNPPPPNLAVATANTDTRAPARQFRIVKHGITATGMPAWGKAGMQDDEIWDLVAFLQMLPTLDAAAYQRQVAASDGHSHASAAQHAAHPSQKSTKKKAGHTHDHAGHTH